MSSGRCSNLRPYSGGGGGNSAFNGKRVRRSFGPRATNSAGRNFGNGKSRLEKWDRDVPVEYRRGR